MSFHKFAVPGGTDQDRLALVDGDFGWADLYLERHRVLSGSARGRVHAALNLISHLIVPRQDSRREDGSPLNASFFNRNRPRTRVLLLLGKASDQFYNDPRYYRGRVMTPAPFEFWPF